MNDIPLIFWLIPLASVAALVMAWTFFSRMMREEEGTPRMCEIAGYVRRGAMAYLKQQYKVVLIVFIVLAVIFAIMAYGFHVQNPWVPFAFLTGGFFSGLAGFFGMKNSDLCQWAYGKRCTARA
jgi:K(+)-stimulated pyrophosphate-energized sodium pump